MFLLVPSFKLYRTSTAEVAIPPLIASSRMFPVLNWSKHPCRRRYCFGNVGVRIVFCCYDPVAIAIASMGVMVIIRTMILIRLSHTGRRSIITRPQGLFGGVRDPIR